MSEISNNIILVILVTSFATYLSRFLGVISSEKIKKTSKIFKWFNCIAYATLAALIARMIVFPAGVLSESAIFLRFIVIMSAIILFLITKKKLGVPYRIISYNFGIVKQLLRGTKCLRVLLNLFLLLYFSFLFHQQLSRWISYTSLLEVELAEAGMVQLEVQEKL